MKFKWGVLGLITVLVVVSLIFFSDYGVNDEVVTRVGQGIGNTENFFQEPIANKEIVVESLSAEKTVIEKKKINSKSSSSESVAEPIVEEENNPVEEISTEEKIIQEIPVQVVKPVQPTSSWVASSSFTSFPKIFPEVFKEMNEKGKARVIISFRERFSFNGFVELFEIDEKTVAGNLTEEGFEAIKNNPKVVVIELDKELEIATDKSFPLINADIVKNMTINGVGMNGTGQTVCVIDTGVAYGHDELGNCTATEYLAGNCTKVIGGYDFFNSDNDPDDDNGHGTAIAGIIAADGTYKGIAPGAKIVSIKITNNFGGAWTSHSVAAINWCVNNASKYNITTISFALSDGGQYTGTICDGGTMDTAVAAANAKNIPVFAPAGNNQYVAGISFPACVSRVISTSAIRDGTLGSQFTDKFWMFSNRGSILDLLAPGFAINILSIPTGTGNAGGTSFASAHTVGSGILLNQYNKERYNITLTPTQIRNILKATGKNITDNQSVPASNLTFPRIDLLRAVNYELIPPVVTLLSPANNSKDIAGAVNFTYNATDHHNILKCSLFVNNVLNQTDTTITKGTTETFTVNNLVSGSYNWDVRCWDNSTFPNQGNSSIYIYRVNYLPLINTIPTQIIVEDINSSADLSSYLIDNDNDTLTMTILNEDTNKVDCGVNGLNLTMNPVSDYFGTANCVIKINDGLEDSNNYTININVTPVNDPPVITTTPINTANIGVLYSYDVDATDIENDTLTFSLTINPTGMSVNSNTGMISWTPSSGQQGINFVTVQVFDGNGIDTQSYNISIGNNNPTITSTPVTTALSRNLYAYQVTATDADLDTLTYSFNQNPANMSIDSSGLISWTPTFSQIGSNYQVEVQVDDPYSGTDTQQFTISVSQNLDGTITSCEYGPMNGGELGENKCVPSDCPSGYYPLILNEHHVSGESHYNRPYRICIKDVTSATLLACEHNCDPGVCPSGMRNIGDIQEIHAGGGITRNYRICVDENEVADGEITTCTSSSNTETNRCIAPQCSGNKISVGEIVDIRPIYSSHGKNRNWWFIGYRICVE